MTTASALSSIGASSSSRPTLSLWKETWVRLVAVVVFFLSVVIYLVLTDAFHLITPLQHSMSLQARQVPYISVEEHSMLEVEPLDRGQAENLALDDGSFDTPVPAELVPGDAWSSSEKAVGSPPRIVKTTYGLRSTLQRMRAAAPVDRDAKVPRFPDIEQQMLRAFVRDAGATGLSVPVGAAPFASLQPSAPSLAGSVAPSQVVENADALVSAPAESVSPFPHIGHLAALDEMLQAEDESIAAAFSDEYDQLFGSLRVLHVRVEVNDVFLQDEEEDRTITSEAVPISLARKSYKKRSSVSNSESVKTPAMPEEKIELCEPGRKGQECLFQPQQSALIRCLLLQNSQKEPLCSAMTCTDNPSLSPSSSSLASGAPASLSPMPLAASDPTVDTPPFPQQVCQVRKNIVYNDTGVTARVVHNHPLCQSPHAPCMNFFLEWLPLSALLPIHHKALYYFFSGSLRKQRKVFSDSVLLVYAKPHAAENDAAETTASGKSAAKSASSAASNTIEQFFTSLHSLRGARSVLFPKSHSISTRVVTTLPVGDLHRESDELLPPEAVDGEGRHVHDAAASIKQRTTQQGTRVIELSTRQAREAGMDGMIFIKHALQLVR